MTTRSHIRSLFLTNRLPYPPIGGATLRNWQNMNSLMKLGPVGVLYLHAEHEQPSSTPVAPPGVSWWSTHTIQRRPALERIGRRLQMLRWWATGVDPFPGMHYSAIATQAVERALEEFQPDLVIFEELALYCYLPVVKRYPCKVIYDAHNAEMILARHILQTEKRYKPNVRFEESIRSILVEATERDFVRRADQVWTCSQHDAYQFKNLSTEVAPVSVVPNGVDVAHYERVRLGYHPAPEELQPTPHTLIFVASFGYTPNVVAAHLLIEQIFPKLKIHYPDSRLLLVGAHPPESIQDAAKQCPGVIVTGKVPDVQPYLAAASVVVVPLLQGSGTRLKILEAFAAGRPVVSTSKGAEGIDAIAGVHLLIRDGVEDIVEGIATLWRDEAMGQTIARAAYELVQAHYSWTAIAQQTQQAVDQLFESNCLKEGAKPVAKL